MLNILVNGYYLDSPLNIRGRYIKNLLREITSINQDKNSKISKIFFHVLTKNKSFEYLLNKDFFKHHYIKIPFKLIVNKNTYNKYLFEQMIKRKITTSFYDIL